MPANSQFEDRLLSAAEASQRLGVSVFTVRRLIKSGDLRAVRISKRVVVPLSEIERAMQQGCGKRATNVRQ